MTSALASCSVANDLEVREHTSGIGPQAGSFSTINRVPPAAVKAPGKYRISRLLLGGGTVAKYPVIPGRCVSIEPGISRFRVRFAPRNDERHHSAVARMEP